MKQFKLIYSLLLMLPFLTVANNSKPSGKHTKEKTIQKEFVVNDNTALELYNGYGNVDITTWDGDQIIIEAQILVNGDDEQTVLRDLKKIDVKFYLNKDRKKLKVNTIGFADIKLHKEVHYSIKAPRTMPLFIYNSYGNVIIDETDAHVSLYASYGSVIAGKLNYKAKIGLSYSQDTKIEYAEKLIVSSSFADFKIKDAKVIDITHLQSSNATIDQVANLLYSECVYGTLNVGKVTSVIDGESEYLTTTIEESSGEYPLKIKSKYGSTTIKKWSNKSVDLDIYGTRLTMGYTKEVPFDLDLNVKGCIIQTTVGALPKSVKDNLIEKSIKEYKGYHMKSNSGRNLNIKIAKGILRFNEY